MKAKTLVITATVLAYLIVGFVVAQYIAGVAYFLVNKTMPTKIAVGTWQSYWDWYSGDPIQRKRLQGAALLAGFIVYLVPLFIIGALRNDRRSLHGDARFARPTEVRKAGLSGTNGIIVGKYKGEFLIHGGETFVLLAAATRSGKGVAVVIPNLLNFADSIVCLDIKLENFFYTSGFRAKHGQDVYLFAPFAEDRQTHRFNLLDTVPRDRDLRVGELLSMGETLWPSKTDPKEKFWNDNARNLFLGLALYLMDTPDLPCTMGEIFRQSSGKGKPIKEHIQGLISGRANGPSALSDECLDALTRFLASPENTLGNIISTFNAPLLIFANPIVDAATSASDFDLRDVRKRRMTIYFGIQPDKLADASLLINLFFSRLINLNIKELPARNESLQYQCLLILDEFTAMGKVGVIARANAFIAGYNLRMLTIIQSISQLEAEYGEKDARTIMTNHALRIVYPPREQKDANEVSEMLGYFTTKATSTGVSRPRAWSGNTSGSTSENTSDQRRALLLPQEVKELGQDEAILFLENTKPILAKKARFYNESSLMQRLQGVSPTLAKAGGRTNEALLKEVAFVQKELCIDVPQLDIDLHKAMIERRTRPAAAGESIDLGRLVIDTKALPPLDDAENPSSEAVAEVVDAFFAQMAWTSDDAARNAIERSPMPDGEPSRQQAPKAGETNVISTEESPKTPRRAGAIDLSVLEN